ncbi:hypothetical protein RFI_10910, partial [Reticulomyxa filosa]
MCAVSFVLGLLAYAKRKRERRKEALIHFFCKKKVSINEYKKNTELFCDIKFVKNIFVRWLSSSSEVLSHVTSRTLAVLFSHAYLNNDQILDLAELLLGVHEKENNYPMENVALMNRVSRSGVLIYGSAALSQSSGSESVKDSDEECSSLSELSTGEPRQPLAKAANNSTLFQVTKTTANKDNSTKNIQMDNNNNNGNANNKRRNSKKIKIDKRKKTKNSHKRISSGSTKEAEVGVTVAMTIIGHFKNADKHRNNLSIDRLIKAMELNQVIMKMTTL